MIIHSMLRKAALGAGFTILLAGFALAQTSPPAPAASKTPHHEMREACRTEVSRDLRGPERREAMRQCVEKKRDSAGLRGREDRRAERETRRTERRAQRQECRKELSEQRLTEKERREQVQLCANKNDPQAMKTLECRKQVEDKKLERGSREFREAMRECRGPRHS
jgi:hypothetical protein